MKRGREDETLDMVNCLMLLSKVGESESDSSASDSSATKLEKSSQHGKVFVCKTCNREFPSFQALGGHRASHKKPNLMQGGAGDLLYLAQMPGSPAKPKTHECPICGVEFAVGQALGGHMRRHRDIIQASAALKVQSSPPVPVLKKSISSKRVSCLNLDLKLAPPDYSQYELQLIS